MENNTIHISLEEQLYAVWQAFCSEQRFSIDKRLRGLFAGRLSKTDGPDFQGAEFQFDGIIYRGDIEIHKSMRDWYAHGHHLDRRYDSVLLHLVWEEGTKNCVPVLNSKRLTVPTYSIKNIEFPRKNEFDLLGLHLNKNLTGFLKQMAILRLTEKARQMTYYCEKYGFDQALYCMMLRILGMPNNSNNFQWFADNFSWQKIQTFKYTFHPDLNYWLLLFYANAGLGHRLPNSEQGIPYPLTRLLPGEIWQHAGQRPCNSPEHHLQALAHFIHKYPDVSLYKTFDSLFGNRWTYPYLLEKIRTMLSVKVGNSGRCYWGKAKITEIVGNVLIPFFYYLANERGSTGYVAYLEDFFLYLPSTGSYSKIQQVIADNNALSDIDNKFYINQALIAISGRKEIHSHKTIRD